MPETPLPGGFVNDVVRVGATVRRRPSPRAAFTHGLLGFLAERGWEGAPRFLGLDERGREVLGHIEGEVPLRDGEAGAAASDSALARVARMVREFHDLTADSPLSGDQEVVCHNDLSPRNTVYATGDGAWRPVAFIDWDLAAPGARVHDVAHVCWQYLDLGPTVTDLPATARRLRLICDAYGLTERTDLIPTILWWQDRCARGIEAAADRGDPAMTALRSRDVPTKIRAASHWLTAHTTALSASL
ncbi:phosphotransferase family protein [Streptomyces sp. NPDC091292]|uniref:phosphotransferase family protein n=1 Tax=Streptomyces sp. NPDC091292 TaxID=3365991 RepID=UPI00382D1AC0